MIIRNAADGDIAAITAIYNHAVRHTTSIWNVTQVTADNRRDWLDQRRAAGLPVLVATQADGAVTGYAAYGPWRPFEGFCHTVEHSVYIHPDHQGRGIGKALMAALIARARADGLHVMIAGIAAENTASIRLHQGFGFVTAGRFPQVGVKFGRWLDLVLMQLTLDDSPAPPPPPAPPN